MRITLILPGGVGRDGVRLVIPALLDLIGRLAARHELLVAALEQEDEPCAYELRGARVICLGRPGGRAVGGGRLAAGGQLAVDGGRLAAGHGLALPPPTGASGASAPPPANGRGQHAAPPTPNRGEAPLWGFGVRYSRLIGALRAFRPDLIHAFWLGTTSSLALLAARALGVPLVASLGGGELVGLPQIGYGGRLSARGRLHAGLAIRGARAVTAGSRYALGPLLPRRPDARWLPLGVEPAAGPSEAPPGPPWRLLHVASINRVKGPELLLAALALARAELRARGGPAEPLELDWVGVDTLGGQIQARAAALGLGRAVRFHGWRPHGEALALARRAHLYLQASLHESQGVAVCEAAAAGVPTVGTAVGLVAELAPAAALATPPGDPAALAGAIIALLDDEPRRAALGAAAREWALAHDAAWTARTFETIYQEVRG